jgi:hypothetical protein
VLDEDDAPAPLQRASAVGKDADAPFAHGPSLAGLQHRECAADLDKRRLIQP